MAISTLGNGIRHLFTPPIKCWVQNLWAVLLFILLAITSRSQETTSIFDKKVTIPSQRTTVYQALSQISDSIGYFFIYDSKVVSSDKRIRPDVKNIPLAFALQTILADTSLVYKVIGNHILIQKKVDPSVKAAATDGTGTLKTITIRGQVFDAQTKEPIPFAAVGIAELGIGNVTNHDGLFTLKINKNLTNKTLTVTHIGYKSKQIPIEVFENEKVDLFLDVNHISIQEVIIRNIDPLTIIKEALARVPDNYADVPSYLTTFYREGVNKGNKYLNYSEAVFRIYKPAYTLDSESDQLKLLKSRKIQNIDITDTLDIKLKGGLSSSLLLDIIKHPPTFLDPDFFQYYNYAKFDITTINSRSVYAIEFEQKENVIEPLLKGIVYIDMESLAIIGSSFQINPKYVSKSADQLVVKRNRKYTIKPVEVRYNVSYQQHNGRYFLSHIRGDLEFRYRRRRQPFSNKFIAFMEMATSSIETQNVKRFDRREIEKTTSVFLENNYLYDESFWLDLNHITPEENLSEAIQRINSKIETVLQKE